MQPFETETGNPNPQAQPTYPTLEQIPQSQGQTSQPQGQNPQNQGGQYPQQHQVQNQPQNQYPQSQAQNLQNQGQYPQSQNQYPQPQGGKYPQYQGQQYPQPQGQYPQAQRPSYPQAQPQGQYPQAQRPSYPNSQPSYPQNYQAPYPNRPSQYPPASYPNYQGQSPLVVYSQGANQNQDAFQKQMMMQQLSRNNKSGGGGLVTLYSLFAAVVAGVIAYTLMNQTNYQVLLQAYQTIAGRNFDPADSFSRDTCQAFLADIIAIPIFLFAFAAFNVFAMCVSFTGSAFCMFIQPLAALIWAGIAVFASQQQCGVAYTILTKLFGANNIPQNSWPYYAAMAVASMLACILNHSWNNSQDKAKRDQRNLALMMAAS